jgi:hypothetical protein
MNMKNLWCGRETSDLSCLFFYLWGQLEALVQADHVQQSVERVRNSTFDSCKTITADSIRSVAADWVPCLHMCVTKIDQFQNFLI